MASRAVLPKMAAKFRRDNLGNCMQPHTYCTNPRGIGQPCNLEVQSTDSDFKTDTALSKAEIDSRICFRDELEAMEADFSDLHLHDTADVNAFYDRLEDRIRETGEDQWFFLVNYSGSRIDPEAWFAFSRRGKTLSMAHSMGSVRYDASDATRRQLKRDAGTDAFDANLFADHDGAVQRINHLKSTRVRKINHLPTYNRAFFEGRLSFLQDAQIMQVNFSDLTFNHSRDVADFYDLAQEKIETSGQCWYFLVNYNNCRIMPEAWVSYAQRGKELNEGGSLGSVRYATGSKNEEEIRLRAQSQGFHPNVRNTREEAIARIDEMKAEATG